MKNLQINKTALGYSLLAFALIVYGGFMFTHRATTYSAEKGFNRTYNGQAYYDLDVHKVCTNEDCSN